MQYLTHSPDHTLLAAIGSTIVQVWNTKAGKKLADFAWESNNTSFCIKNDGTVVGINKLGDIELWSISKGTLIERRNLLAGFEKPKDTSTQIEVMLTWVLSPDGRTLVAHLGQKKGRPGQKQGPEGDYGKVVVAWDIATGKELWRQFDKDTGYGFLFSPDGKWFAQHVGWNGELGELICCDAATAQVKARVVLDKIDPRIGVIRSSDRPALPVRARAIAPDCKTVVFATHRAKLVLWDSTGQQPLKEIALLPSNRSPSRAPFRNMPDIAISTDGKSLLAACDQHLQLLDLAAGKLLLPWEGHRQAVIFLAYSVDGRSITSRSGWMRGYSSFELGDVLTWNVVGAKLLGRSVGADLQSEIAAHI